MLPATFQPRRIRPARIYKEYKKKAEAMVNAADVGVCAPVLRQSSDLQQTLDFPLHPDTVGSMIHVLLTTTNTKAVVVTRLLLCERSTDASLHGHRSLEDCLASFRLFCVFI